MAKVVEVEAFQARRSGGLGPCAGEVAAPELRALGTGEDQRARVSRGEVFEMLNDLGEQECRYGHVAVARRRLGRAGDERTTREEATLLEVPTGSAVIRLIHNAAGENGDALEVSGSIWPSDRVLVIGDYDIAQEPEEQAGMSDV